MFVQKCIMFNFAFVSKMSAVPKVQLSGGLEICRILNGMWQLSGAHGKVDRVKAGDPHCGCPWTDTLKAEQESEENINLIINPQNPVNLSAVNRFTVTHLEIPSGHSFLANATTTTPSSLHKLHHCRSWIVFVCVMNSSYYNFHYLVIVDLLDDAVFSCSNEAATFSLQLRTCRPMSTLDWPHSTWRTFTGLQRKSLDSSTVRYTHRHTLCDGAGCSLSGSSGTVWKEKQTAAQNLLRLSVC